MIEVGIIVFLIFTKAKFSMKFYFNCGCNFMDWQSKSLTIQKLEQSRECSG